MSRLRRFRHLEGKRPERSAAAQPENTFAPQPAAPPAQQRTVAEPPAAVQPPQRHVNVEPTARQATVACARCGEVLADGETCTRCSPPAERRGDFLDGAPAPSSSRTDRFRNLAGTGSVPLGREVQPRTAGSEIATTVPAWRGEALPPEIAADVRRQLGIPEQQEVQREDLLGWAQRQLEKPGTRNLLLLLGAGYFGRRLIGNLIGLVAAFMILVFFLAYSACS